MAKASVPIRCRSVRLTAKLHDTPMAQRIVGDARALATMQDGDPVCVERAPAT